MFVSLVRNKLLWVAVLPPALLLLYIYRMDTIDREPPQLLLKIFLRGVLACIPAVIFEYIGEYLLTAFVDSESGLYLILNSFAVVAFSEEFFKLAAAKKYTWFSYEFNYRFDGIIYAVFASMGFATLENILYVYQYGFGTGIMRAVLAIPGHMMFGVFTGIFYGKAKEMSVNGKNILCCLNMIFAVLIPTVLHGIYDYCIFAGTNQSMVFFVCYVTAAYLYTFFIIHRYQKHDYCIWR